MLQPCQLCYFVCIIYTQALEKGKLMLASKLPGGLTNTKVTSFVSPSFSKVSLFHVCPCVWSFSKVLDEAGCPELIGRIKVQNKQQQQQCGGPSSAKAIPLLMDTKQLWLLHTALVKWWHNNQLCVNCSLKNKKFSFSWLLSFMVFHNVFHCDISKLHRRARSLGQLIPFQKQY